MVNYLVGNGSAWTSSPLDSDLTSLATDGLNLSLLKSGVRQVSLGSLQNQSSGGTYTLAAGGYLGLSLSGSATQGQSAIGRLNDFLLAFRIRGQG